jgi:hypothetical protein
MEETNKLLAQILEELKEIKIFLAPHSTSINEDNTYTITPCKKVGE